MPRGYAQGDRHHQSRDHVRDDAASEREGHDVLIPQEWHYFINDEEVTEQEYGEAQAEYHRLRSLGLVP